MNRAERKSIATAPASPAPLHILAMTLPLWGACLLLTFFMPVTGIATSMVIGLCLLVLPFKARRGACPNCGMMKTLPFSGFGNGCKGCGEELVLRGDQIHQIEPKPDTPRPARPRSGRH